MLGKMPIRKEKSIKDHISRATSYCHTLVDCDDECLDDIITLLIEHKEIYGNKHRLSLANVVILFILKIKKGPQLPNS